MAWHGVAVAVAVGQGLWGPGLQGAAPSPSSLMQGSCITTYPTGLGSPRQILANRGLFKSKAGGAGSVAKSDKGRLWIKGGCGPSCALPASSEHSYHLTLSLPPYAALSPTASCSKVTEREVMITTARFTPHAGIGE